MRMVKASSSKTTNSGLSIAKKVEEKRVVFFQFEANASATKGDQSRTTIWAWKKQARKKVIINRTDNNIDTRTVKRKNQVSLYTDEGEVDKRIRLALDECTNIWATGRGCLATPPELWISFVGTYGNWGTPVHSTNYRCLFVELPPPLSSWWRLGYLVWRRSLCGVDSGSKMAFMWIVKVKVEV